MRRSTSAHLVTLLDWHSQCLYHHGHHLDQPLCDQYPLCSQLQQFHQDLQYHPRGHHQSDRPPFLIPCQLEPHPLLDRPTRRSGHPHSNTLCHTRCSPPLQPPHQLSGHLTHRLLGHPIRRTIPTSRMGMRKTLRPPDQISSLVGTHRSYALSSFVVLWLLTVGPASS